MYWYSVPTKVKDKRIPSTEGSLGVTLNESLFFFSPLYVVDTVFPLTLFSKTKHREQEM